MKIKKLSQKIAKYYRIFVNKVQEARMEGMTESIIVIAFILTLVIASTWASINLLKDIVFQQSTYYVETREIPYNFTATIENGSYPVKYAELLRKPDENHLYCRKKWHINYNRTTGDYTVTRQGEYYEFRVTQGIVEFYKYVDLIPPDTEKLKFTMFLRVLSGFGYVNITFNEREVAKITIEEKKSYFVDLDVQPDLINSSNVSSGFKLRLIVETPNQQILCFKIYNESLKAYPKNGRQYFPLKITFVDVHGFKGVSDYLEEIFDEKFIFYRYSR